jgi:hypothetical protein
MPTVIGHHDVKDTAHWLASSKREEVFGPLGVTNIRTFVNPQNPTQGLRRYRRRWRHRSTQFESCLSGVLLVLVL